MARVLRTPLLHFLVIGGVLLGLRTWWDPSPSKARVVISAGDVERLRAEWTEEHGAPPSPATEQALVREAIDQEVLYREALARGFDRRDEAVRERLVRLGSFVGEETGRDRAALEREARRLGLERSDLVVRRHLIEMMRLAAGWLGPEELPSDAELESYLARHAEEFMQPARIQLAHVYLSRETRGAAATIDAGRLLGELRRTDVAPEAAVMRGDAFIRGAEVEGTLEDIARVFGPGFADAIGGATPRMWFGPVESSYGVHLVWVRERAATRTPALAEVRGRVLHRVLRERRQRREWETMEAIRARYVVEVDGG